MKTILVAVSAAAVLSLTLAASSSAEPRSQGGAAYKTPTYMEQFLLHGIPGGVYVQYKGVRYGPVQSATCRGDGAFVRAGGDRRYRRFVCAERVKNADKLLFTTNYTTGQIRVLGWR